MLQHPQAHDEVEGLVDKRQAFGHPPDHRHANGAVPAQRRPIGIEARGKLYVAPDFLDQTAPAASEVQDAAG